MEKTKLILITNIKKEKGYFYYIDKNNCIYREKMEASSASFYENLFSNPNRLRILTICKEEPYKYNIRSLSRKINIGVKSIFHHIKILKKAGLIKTKYGLGKGGKRTLIATNIKHPLVKEII